MELLKNKFEEVKKTEDVEEINNFLINLSKNPRIEYLPFIEFFMKNLEPQIIEKIKMNLIFFLGEIGESNSLKMEFLDFISNSYYTSDRWIRHEIIESIGKISLYTKLPEDLVTLVGVSINDEYIPIKKSALKVLLELEDLPNLRGVLQVLNSKDAKLVESGLKVLKKSIPHSTLLFKTLDSSDNYQCLKVIAIRTLLLTFFKSIVELESFRDDVLNSSWENDYKENYLKEIETYLRILLIKT
jgi:hypothetical protein